MGKLVDGLNVVISNPDDLSTLPTLVAMANEMESNEQGYQERIEKLLASNRSLLAQIPIASEQEPEEEDTEPTWEDVGDILADMLKE